MKKAQLPLNEEVRLAELASYKIMDTPNEKEFDDLAELLRQVTGTEMCAISFIDGDRQWFKAGFGLPGPGSPRDISMCTWTILDSKATVITDPQTDDRFHDNPFVTGDFHLRFYAGHPITTPGGNNIGSVCVFDNQAREFSEIQQRSLELIASQVTKLLELRLKNQLIMQKADELISIERKSLQMTLVEQDNERRSIGVELHENFAQVLAACMMYLNLARESKQSEDLFLDKTHEELAKLLEEMRKLSRTINPISVESVSLEEILRDYMRDYQSTHGINMRLDWKGNHSLVSGESALNLFRIVVQYVSLVSPQRELKSVVIRVEVKGELALTIHSDGDSSEIDLEKKKISINSILSRIDLCDGKYDLKVIHQRSTVFRVCIPLELPELAA